MSEIASSLPPSAEPETPLLTQVQRVVYAYTAPSRTFTDILRDTSWWLPFLLAVLVTYGFVFVVQKQVTWARVADNALKQDPKQEERFATMPPVQAEQAKQIMVRGFQYGMYAAPLIAIVTALLASAILLATLNFGFGGQAKFGSILAVWFYAGLPGLIKFLLAIILLSAGVIPDLFSPSNPVATNIGAFLNPLETPRWIVTLLSSLDIFTIWTVVLLGIGCATVANLKRSSGYIAVFGWWILIVLASTAVAALRG